MWESKVVERILHNMSLLMDRSFKSVQELNRYRKELQRCWARAGAAPAPALSVAAPPAFLAQDRRPAAQAAARVAALPGPVVFTNGVFDVLHRGHVTYLAQARALGASLVVALNTDASARRLGKGPDRPAEQRDRTAPLVMAALESVSLVTWFDEDTPVAAARRSCGRRSTSRAATTTCASWRRRALVEGYGGRALAIPFVDGYSTTELVRRIRAPDARVGLRTPDWRRRGLIRRARPPPQAQPSFALRRRS